MTEILEIPEEINTKLKRVLKGWLKNTISFLDFKKTYLEILKTDKESHKDKGWSDYVFYKRAFTMLKNKIKSKNNYNNYDYKFENQYQEFLQLRKKKEYLIEENEEILQTSEIKETGYSKKEFDKLFKNRKDFYKSNEWKIRLKEIKKRDLQSDLLRLFNDGYLVKSKEVHHIFPLCYYPEIALDPYNLIALDKGHHKDIYYFYKDPLKLFYRMIEILKIFEDYKKKYGEKTLLNIIDIISRYNYFETNKKRITIEIKELKIKIEEYSKELRVLTKEINRFDEKIIDDIKKLFKQK